MFCREGGSVSDRKRVAVSARSEKKIRVLLVDDHTLVREGLRKFLEDTSEIQVIADVGDGRTALKALERLKPDLVLMDISMPGLNGIDAIKLMLKSNSRMRVLVLSMHCSEAYVLEALKAGAHGFVLKSGEGRELVEAIRLVAAGESYFSPQVSAILASRYRTQDEISPGETSSLSLREREILQLLGEGKTLSEIAGILSITRKTVKNHRNKIANKLCCRSNADLVKAAIRLGLTS